jgi:multiple sugar transport system substrate-binding protein
LILRKKAIGDEKVTTPDNPKVIEALEWCVKCYDQILGINGPMPSSWPSFDQKKLAMIIDGSWALNTYSSISGLDYGVAQAPYPQGGDPTTWSCGFAMCLSANSKAQNIDAAWKFVKYITGREGWLIQAEYQYSQSKKNWTA